MKPKKILALSGWALLLVALPLVLSAQRTRADYERAAGLRNKLQNLVFNAVDRSGWIDKTTRFWYRKWVKGGIEFMVADVATQSKKPTFDHEKLAAALATSSGEKVDAKNLPFMFISFVDNEKAVEFEFGEWRWTCDLAAYACTKVRPAERRGRPGLRWDIWERGPAPEAFSVEAKTSPDGQWEAFIKN